MDHPNTAAQMLDTGITKFIDLGIKIEYRLGQSYDNASNMSGIYSSLQARVKQLCRLAEYIACAGHSLNLVVVKVAESCTTAVDFFGFVQ